MLLFLIQISFELIKSTHSCQFSFYMVWLKTHGNQGARSRFIFLLRFNIIAKKKISTFFMFFLKSNGLVTVKCHMRNYSWTNKKMGYDMADGLID
jgi:hypothetical protein